jgi:signal transduction histidine kinase
MLRVVACISEQHDLRLVVLAAFICLFATHTAFSLLARAGEAAGRDASARWACWVWIAAASAVTGSGVWTTHFVAMLAFKSNLPAGYDVGLTAASIAIAVGITNIGYAVPLVRPRLAALGGAIAGAAIAAMHYAGMAALQVPAIVRFDGGYVAASIIVGVTLGGIALHVAAGAAGLRRRIIGASLFTLAICGMHFTGMASVTLVPDPTIALPDEVIAPEWLAVAVAAVTVLIIALGFIGSVVDEHLAGRAAAEAERLRAYVAELEQTKGRLEAASKDLATALEAAAAGSQAKSQFLAAMSHELRTPLNAVIGFAELMAAESFGQLGDARYRDYATNIRDSGRYLLGRINDILDFSKLDSGRLLLDEETIDLGETLASVRKMVAEQAAESAVSLTFEAAPDLLYVHADPRRIRQVLFNLVHNAIKFTPAGGEVTVKAMRCDAGVAISVADTGIGIAPEDVPTALERFGQIDGSLARRYEGTGLGLPLSKRLVELHGGKLDLRSEVGVGTTVSILLPAAASLLPESGTRQVA